MQDSFGRQTGTESPKRVRQVTHSSEGKQGNTDSGFVTPRSMGEREGEGQQMRKRAVTPFRPSSAGRDRPTINEMQIFSPNVPMVGGRIAYETLVDLPVYRQPKNGGLGGKLWQECMDDARLMVSVMCSEIRRGQDARTRLSSASTLGDIFTVDGLLADVRKRLSESPSFAASTELRELDSHIGRARDSLRNLRLFGDATPELSLTPSAPSMEDLPASPQAGRPASTVETTQVEGTVTTPCTETLREAEVAEIAEERPEEAPALHCHVAEEQSGVMQDQVMAYKTGDDFGEPAAELPRTEPPAQTTANDKDMRTKFNPILEALAMEVREQQLRLAGASGAVAAASARDGPEDEKGEDNEDAEVDKLPELPSIEADMKTMAQRVDEREEAERVSEQAENEFDLRVKASSTEEDVKAEALAEETESERETEPIEAAPTTSTRGSLEGGWMISRSPVGQRVLLW
uniref:Uncharacterized protein n=1 Tax=Chromera velia CCMP2878 TaxID=1169474 RepID=A0A0G4IEK8_9ALVE|eukprot:Cvel_13650.t1-p1 / transcript=Cvel_13650.t1 / gene=Cvel_13650 / organism=Chromera_velia_CCMP2878 / gene_product=hypothetical protein / transcript_product=hypothetical protein / location=Cvel_scaffold941:28215-36874(-) / protein_length=460 / sequence_SO=supercontig / SO=protein_coding / is_pseudo=false